MRVYLQAWRDLYERYVAIFRAVWREKHLLDFPQRSNLEREFLPAALELEETPVSPYPRLAIALIVGFTAIAFLWAILGKLDVVVVAQGKIVPNDRTKIIQPMEIATVKAIRVQDGQWVKAGEVLLELDSTSTQADENRTQGDWTVSRLAAAANIAMLRVIQNPTDPKLSFRLAANADLLAEVPADQIAAAENVFLSQAQDFKAKLDKAQAEVARTEADLASNREILRKQEETLPIVRERADEYKKLFDQGYVSKHEYLDHEKDRIELEHDLSAQTRKVAELEAALLEAQHVKNAFVAETRRTTQENLTDNRHRAETSRQEKIKAVERNRSMTITAPVSGKVQQLVVHTVGGVVTPAQALMSIVPAADSVEIEAFLQNKDVGFVRENQDVVVKVEAFPYTQFSTVPGRVSMVSLDAIQDEKKGLIYATRVELLKNSIRVGDKDVPLSAGMAVACEIKTAKRRVFQYFLSPLLAQTSESLRER